jgi:hypothetical protein
MQLLGEGPFDFQQSRFGGSPAMRRKAAQLSVRGKHSMAGDDNRKRVFSECTPNRARRTGHAEPNGDIAVSDRAARWNPARDVVHSLVKRWHGAHVEFDVRETPRFAPQHGNDASDCLFNRLRWACQHRAGR